jgi:hypothetical protein
MVQPSVNKAFMRCRHSMDNRIGAPSFPVKYFDHGAALKDKSITYASNLDNVALYLISVSKISR